MRVLRAIAPLWLRTAARSRTVRGPSMPAVGRGYGTILILGHMRAGTSLLAHLLCGHPQIAGWGERNRPYATTGDLARLAADVARRARAPRIVLPPPLGPRWLLDVVNHDAFMPPSALLARHDIRLIFVLREPRGCLASMVAALGRDYGWTPRRCATYYAGRLDSLQAYAEGLDRATRRRCLTVEHEALIDDPVRVLAAVAGHLGLGEPPAASYPRQPWTGSFGDRSRAIHAGRVLSAEERHRLHCRPQGPLELDPLILAHCAEAYGRCRSSMVSLGA